jgi:hypothetical protein
MQNNSLFKPSFRFVQFKFVHYNMYTYLNILLAFKNDLWFHKK